MQVDSVWFASVTRTDENSGTDSGIGFVITTGNADLLAHEFIEDTPQKDFERGQANVYEVDASATDLDDSAIAEMAFRLANLGSDQWRPEVVMAWGVSNRPGRDPNVAPIAFETDIDVRLSSGPQDIKRGAVPSMLIHPAVDAGGQFDITDVVLIVQTRGTPDDGFSIRASATQNPEDVQAGTDDAITLQIVRDGIPVLNREVPNTPQLDLEAGQANLYVLPTAAAFSRNELDTGSIVLRISGHDSWVPARLFLFGIGADTGTRRPVVPLVHLDEWPFGRLSTDTGEGKPEVVLPILALGSEPFSGSGTLAPN